LAGKTLAERAVATLAQVCERVRIVGSSQLDPIAATVSDSFLECGPLGGMEAALRDASHEWLLFLPVDLPFLPYTMLRAWAGVHLHQADPALRIGYLEADGRPQPLVCLLQRTLLPHIQDALRNKQYKVTHLFHQIAETLAPSLSVRPERVLQKAVLNNEAQLSVERSGICEWIPWSPTPQEAARRSLWFSNLNTPEEFAHAESSMQELLI
jgi:molybdopterin-guanine dinucleotide biosynthesis protein A